MKGIAAFSILLVWILPARLPAQKAKDKPTPGDEMIYKYL